MARYEITQSLLSAWNYVHSCWEGQEESALESFLSTLRGEKPELTEEQLQNIQNGFDFEKLVSDLASGKPVPDDFCPKWRRAADEFAALLSGAQFQVRIQKPITVNGMDFEIHGVLDALREGVIYDIKFRNKSFGSLDLAGDYLDSPQHPFYFYLVPEARKFLYLVSDGSDIYIEQYTPEDTRKADDIIAEFMDFLNAAGLMDVYKEHWQVDG